MKNRGGALVHTVKYFLGIDKAQTQTTILEQECIVRHARDANTAVEIGVFEGANTKNILQSLSRTGVLYAIDPFFKGSLGISYGRIISHLEIVRSKRKAQCKVIADFSFNAVNQVPNEVDFIFIDGDHSYDGFQRDWEDWLPKVKVGGKVLLHDTSVPDHNAEVASLGSFRYFQEHKGNLEDFKVVETLDSINVLERIR